MSLCSAASPLSGVDSSLTPCPGDAEPPGPDLLSACAVPSQETRALPLSPLTGAANSGKVSRAKGRGPVGGHPPQRAVWKDGRGRAQGW